MLETLPGDAEVGRTLLGTGLIGKKAAEPGQAKVGRKQNRTKRDSIIALRARQTSLNLS